MAPSPMYTLLLTLLLAFAPTPATAFAPTVHHAFFVQRQAASRRSMPPLAERTSPSTDDAVVQQVTNVEQAMEALEPLETVEEAIEVLEQQQLVQEGEDQVGEEQVVLQLQPTEEELQVLQEIKDFDRDTIAGDIQALMEANENDIVATITDFVLSLVDETTKQKENLEPKTNEEAAVSASLYMNPATATIASNLVISWEPAVAEILDRMSRVCNPGRPFMVGVVG